MQYLEEVDGQRVKRTEQDYMIARHSPDFLQVMAWESGVIWPSAGSSDESSLGCLTVQLRSLLSSGGLSDAMSHH